ncbi:MAG: ribosome recycling factor [Candidatus Omnitrophota bacterium]
MKVKEIVHNTEERIKKAIEATKREFSEIRTGRASPSLVEGLRIDYYGTPTLLKQIASISIPDARLIVIQPWDLNALKEIEKAILKSNLGITPMNDGKVVRLSIPQLSTERRDELAKVVKNMAEEGRISLRTIRREANDSIKKLESDKVIAEDDRFKGQDAIQKLIDRYIKNIDQILEDKEKELTQFS